MPRTTHTHRAQTRTLPLKGAGLIGMTAALTLSSCAWAGGGPDVGYGYPADGPVSTVVQARVLSSTPVMAQVAVPRQVCFDELQPQAQRSNGAGALMGAIAGGAVGNAVGKGVGNALATGLGVIGGAVLGDHIQNDGRPVPYQTVRRCEQQAAYENRVVAYDVVFEYNGQRQRTQTSQPPGATIPVTVTVSAAQAPVYGQQPPTYVTPARYAPELVYQDGWRGAPRGGHRGRHWD